MDSPEADKTPMILSLSTFEKIKIPEKCLYGDCKYKSI